MLAGKNVVLGVTGGIAAYKAAELVRLLVKEDATVDVIMTRNAAEFIAPLTFQTLSNRVVHVETFKLLVTSDISHTTLADRADLIIVAPATANFIGKFANGVADDMLTTTLLATLAPVLVAPAMNPKMWAHPAVLENVARLAARGVDFIGPEEGEVACKDIGRGRMSEPADILEAAEGVLTPPRLRGKRLVVTAGPTREPLDPVRFISNRSSGRMGYALARAARLMGAEVVLVSGPTALVPPRDVEVMSVETALEMQKAVKSAFAKADALIMAAAVADFRPAAPKDAKAPKDEYGDQLALARNPDIIAGLAKSKGKKLVVGFAAETGEADAKAAAKLKRKGLSAIVVNDVSEPGIGFESEDNEVRILFADGRSLSLARMAKADLAFEILMALFS
jgi:phosphopantothenoylcysteine decarboxylase/phosphopantothenate--cysteine ligase